jgi:hypothetical protein
VLDGAWLLSQEEAAWDPASAAVNTAFGESGYAAEGDYGDSTSFEHGAGPTGDGYGDGSEGYYGNPDAAWADGKGYSSHGYAGHGGSTADGYGYGHGGGGMQGPGSNQYATAMGGGMQGPGSNQYATSSGFPLYKTKLCYTFMNFGSCNAGAHCPCPHGHQELVGCAAVHAPRMACRLQVTCSTVQLSTTKQCAISVCQLLGLGHAARVLDWAECCTCSGSTRSRPLVTRCCYAHSSMLAQYTCPPRWLWRQPAATVALDTVWGCKHRRHRCPLGARLRASLRRWASPGIRRRSAPPGSRCAGVVTSNQINCAGCHSCSFAVRQQHCW